LARKAAVVRPGEWAAIESPPLVRVELDGAAPAALLAVWGHPLLADWLGRLTEPPPHKAWHPGSGTRPAVIFRSGSAGILLHEAVGHLVESDLVASGDSPLADQLGAAVTASTLNLADDPTRWDLPGAFTSDDEGVPAAPRRVLEGGRLVSWLSDRFGARALGGIAGRGRRASWDRPPIARLSNLVAEPGDASPDDLERELGRGLVVERLGGATVDPGSSRLVLRVERAWELSHGRRRRATAPFELTGGVLDVLAHIDPELGSERSPDWRLGWCVKDGVPLATGSEAPAMVVRGLEVL
jgi:TldD protein